VVVVTRHEAPKAPSTFATVIVPLDGSPHAECVLPSVIEEARRHHATIVLVHVIPRPEPCTSPVRRSGPLPWHGEWPFEDLEAAKRDAHTYLHDVVTRFGLDPNTVLRVAVGDPGARIAAEAALHPQPLVVMLTGDRTRQVTPPLSLVASYLLVASAVPVLALRQPAALPSPVAAADTLPAMLARPTWPGPPMMPSPMRSPTQSEDRPLSQRRA
jgi:nucleotide-binding universal stress UspA family protein